MLKSFKDVMRKYVTYDSNEWRTMRNDLYRLKMELLDNRLSGARQKLHLLELLSLENFTCKYERLNFERGLSETATLLGCYDADIFGAIASHDQHEAHNLVAMKFAR
jgi:hypothetical protein